MKKQFVMTLLGAAAIAGLATPALADRGGNDDRSFPQWSQRDNHGQSFEQLSRRHNDDEHKDKINSWDSQFRQRDRHVERQGHIAAVPEPETYALMLAGLAVVAFVARRRRR